MKIIIVRHGQTQENIEKIIQEPKAYLTELGRQQAEVVAEKLKNEKIDVVYTSDLLRAVETTKEIIKFHPSIKVVQTKELREKDAGIFKGKSLEEQKKVREASGTTFYEFLPEGGESIVDLQNRVVKFYKELINAYKNETILLVTHGGTIKSLLLYLLNKPFEEWVTVKVENTAFTVIEVDNKKLHTMHTLNSIEHLDGTTNTKTN